MKIRLDFVTNSISYNTAVVVIDNPVLLEILQKYKDMGLFGEHKPFFGIGSYESYAHDYFGVRVNVDNIRTPAFYYYEDDDDDCRSDDLTFGCPGTLDDVLVWIISIMAEGSKHLDEEIFAELRQELVQKDDEINHAYLEVYWSNKQCWDSGNEEYEFQYDIVNGERSIHITPEEKGFYDIVAGGDFDEEEELRDNLGYGKKGSEKDDYWEYTKRVGFIDNFDNFPMEEYDRYKKTGEIKLFKEWITYFGNEERE